MAKKRHIIKQTTLRLTAEEIAAICRIRAAHPAHLISDNGAIRWALLEIDRQLQQQNGQEKT